MAESIEALRARLNTPVGRLKGWSENRTWYAKAAIVNAELQWTRHTALNLLMEIEVARQKEQYPPRVVPSTYQEAKAIALCRAVYNSMKDAFENYGEQNPFGEELDQIADLLGLPHL